MKDESVTVRQRNGPLYRHQSWDSGREATDSFEVGVRVNIDVFTRYETQIMTLVGLSMLSKWCRNLRLDLPEIEIRLPNRHILNLKEHVKDQMGNGEMQGNIAFGRFDDGDVDQVLNLGKTYDDQVSDSIWANADGWIAGWGSGIRDRIKPSGKCPNPIGAIFAACLANAELYRRFKTGAREDISEYHSLFDLRSTKVEPSRLSNPDIGPEIDLGDILQVGCGAIGSNLDLFLHYTCIKGSMAIIDPEKVDAVDLKGSLIYCQEHVRTKRGRADVCCNVLQRSRFSVSKYGENSDLTIPRDFRAVLCLTDDTRLMKEAISGPPKLTYHATTTPNCSVTLCRHIPHKEGCVYHPCMDEGAFDGTYRAIGASPTGPGRTVLDQCRFPFLTAASGVLVLSELIKLSFPKYPLNENLVQFSFKRRTGEFVTSHHPSMTESIQAATVSHDDQEILRRELIWRLNDVF